jgi:general secretion pathway protein L
MAVRDLNLPAIGPRLSELARRSGLAGFWPWWTAQLNAMVPPRPRAALERRRMRPVLVFDGDHATLWRPGMEGERAVMAPASTIALTGDAATIAGAGRAAMASLASGSYGASAVTPKVLLSLPSRDVLRKTLTLPSAVEPSLRQTLAYDLDRHTPFKPEEIYFDAAVVGRNSEKKEILVDLVSCRKAVVDAAIRHATAWGAAVSAAVPEPPATAATSRLNLLPHESRPSLAVWMRWQFWLPLALVAAVALAAIAIPLWQKRDYAIVLNGLAADARTQARVSDALRTELETKVGDYNFALDKKYAYPSALRVVDEVSRVLPDDTWLTQMELKTIAKGKESQREILVRGETANAGRLVQLFEESPLFAQTAPRSPTTKIQPGPGEIFDLGAQLKPLAAPTQVALLGAERSPEPASAPASAAVVPTAPVATPPAATAATAPAATPQAVPTGTAPDAQPASSAPATTPAASTGSAPPTSAPGVATPPPIAAPPKPSGVPLSPVAPAPAPRAAVPAAGAPDPWVSAPSAPASGRPARAMTTLAPPASTGAGSAPSASGGTGPQTNTAPSGVKP